MYWSCCNMDSACAQPRICPNELYQRTNVSRAQIAQRTHALWSHKWHIASCFVFAAKVTVPPFAASIRSPLGEEKISLVQRSPTSPLRDIRLRRFFFPFLHTSLLVHDMFHSCPSILFSNISSVSSNVTVTTPAMCSSSVDLHLPGRTFGLSWQTSAYLLHLQPLFRCFSRNVEHAALSGTREQKLSSTDALCELAATEMFDMDLSYAR